ncbi:MAG: hypothetical protein NXI00_20005 [Cytophagales bacterium]|nr:hypothetical protein [Cytophagales bacterium]
MTWRQVLNIQHGRGKAIRNEHERRVLEARVLTEYIANKIGGGKASYDDIYKVSDGTKKPKVEKNLLSIEAFHKLLVSAFESEKE